MTPPNPRGIPSPLPVIERRIGGTFFTVTACYSPTATENAVNKIHRILLKEALKKQNVHMNNGLPPDFTV